MFRVYILASELNFELQQKWELELKDDTTGAVQGGRKGKL